MPCLRPFTIKKDTGEETMIPCGNCNYCLMDKRVDWTFRIQQEMKVAKSAFFLTLTYDEQNVPLDDDGNGHLSKVDIQKFMRRLRKQNKKIDRNSVIRYYTIGEYGGETLRPHYHSIMFNCDISVMQHLNKIWNKGFVKIGSVTEASIHYVTGYCMTKNDTPKYLTKPFALISKRSGGLGKNYLVKATKWHKENQALFVQNGLFKHRLPRFYKDKIFDKEEKRILSMKSKELFQAMDKQEVERLSKLHNNPYIYMEERKKFNEKLIGKKLTKSKL
ncbi:MAG: replication initiator protein [Microviridae sp.]|nr:MAG: replication initiator protein [Microviridae sp.]